MCADSIIIESTTEKPNGVLCNSQLHVDISMQPKVPHPCHGAVTDELSQAHTREGREDVQQEQLEQRAQTVKHVWCRLQHPAAHKFLQDGIYSHTAVFSRPKNAYLETS